MRKFLCGLCSIILLITMCSCTNAENGSSVATVASESELSKDAVSTPQTDSGEEKPDKPPTSSEESSSKEETNDTKPPNIQPPGLFSYTVNDAENTRGLDTKKHGFSYGVAKNGVPNQQSVINQQYFDSLENIQALALDTKTQEKVMYLTFDNGYEYKNLTADILDTLKEKNVKAAFFVTLSYAKKNPELIQRMIDEGHIIGNHSASHKSYPTLTRTQMAEDIAKFENYVRENFSYEGEYFRFPSGEYSECALDLVASIGFKSVFWSVAYADWDTSVQKGADYAFTTVTSRFHPGAVILLHAVSQDNADALGRIIDHAHSQGYTFKGLDDYFG